MGWGVAGGGEKAGPGAGVCATWRYSGNLLRSAMAGELGWVGLLLVCVLLLLFRVGADDLWERCRGCLMKCLVTVSGGQRALKRIRLFAVLRVLSRC